MHDLPPLARSAVTSVGVFATFVSVAFGWAAFLLDGAGKCDAANAFFLMAATVGVSAGFLIRTVWHK